jgi:tRNA (guanine37-N1)-methyltransferase
MHYARIDREHAESMKRLLVKKNAFDRNGAVLHSESYVLFPVSIATGSIKKLIKESGGSLISKNVKKSAPTQTYRETIADILTKKERGMLARGYDLLGNIAIIEIDGKLRKKEKRIAAAIMRTSKGIETVLAKAGPVSGRYRTRSLRYVAGKRSHMADYNENGCRFIFDVRKSFFSNRLSFERNRISSMSKKSENVIVMFAGVGPFAIEVAKRNPKANVVAIELNGDAYASMCGNIMLNKAKNVTAVLGDVKQVAQRYAGFADRVVMPLPKDSIEFLSDAVGCCKKKATIHMYMITDRHNPGKEAVSVLKDHARAHGYRASASSWRIVRNYSPKEVEVVVDLLVRKRVKLRTRRSCPGLVDQRYL